MSNTSVYPKHLPKYKVRIDNINDSQGVISLFKFSSENEVEEARKQNISIFCKRLALSGIIMISVGILMYTLFGMSFWLLIILVIMLCGFAPSYIINSDAFIDDTPVRRIDAFPENEVAKMALKGGRNDDGYWVIPPGQVGLLEKRIEFLEERVEEDKVELEKVFEERERTFLENEAAKA